MIRYPPGTILILVDDKNWGCSVGTIFKLIKYINAFSNLVVELEELDSHFKSSSHITNTNLSSLGTQLLPHPATLSKLGKIYYDLP